MGNQKPFTMSKSYFVYAGYYELLITDKTLSRPYTLLSAHRTLGKAITTAERYDADAQIIYDRDLREEVVEHFIETCPWIALNEPEEEFTFFDGNEVSIAGGLTDVTLQALSHPATRTMQPSVPDFTDIVNFIACRTRESVRSLRRRLQGKPYQDLRKEVLRLEPILHFYKS